MSPSFLIAFVVGVLIVVGLGVARTHAIYKVRIRFIDERYHEYYSLPSFDEMADNFKYFHLWTFNQWVNWVEKQK